MTQGPPPLPPIPAIPVQPIDPMYWQPAPRRPGIITAIGVCSIVIAALAMMSNAAMVMNASLMLAIMNVQQQFPPQPAGARSGDQATTVVGDEFLPESGMPVAQRNAMVHALDDLQPMSATRRDNLHQLLQSKGKQLFEDDAIPTSMAGFRDLVGDHGQHPALRGVEGRHYFHLKSGRLEVDDEHAVFSRPGGQVVRASAVPLTPAPWNASADLSPAQRQVLVDTMQTMALPDVLNEQQLAAIDSALAEPWQTFAMPAASVSEMRGAVESVTIGADGMATIVMDVGTMRVTPEGLAYDEWDSLAGIAPGASPPTMPGGIVWTAVTEGMLSGLLAIFLLIAGIMMLRQSTWARKAHWWYVWVKLPLGIVGGLAWGAFYVAMFDYMGGPTDQLPRWLMWVFAAGYALMAIAYPVFLLFAMRTSSARAYFDAMDPTRQGTPQAAG